MTTAEFMLSKRSVLRFTAALFFLLKLFLSHIYCIPKKSFVFSYNNGKISTLVSALLSKCVIEYKYHLKPKVGLLAALGLILLSLLFTVTAT